MAKAAMKLREKMEESARTENAAMHLRERDAAAAPSRRTSTQGRGTAAARIGKKATVGHFSEEMSRALNVLAAEHGRTLQSFMGEAWDLVLEKYGKQPFNER